MGTLQTLVFLMSIATVVVGLALRFRISYPIALVLGGTVLGFIPGLNELDIEPNLVLAIVLPPILYYAAYSIPFKEFKKNIQEILGLALGLVLVTTLVIGMLFKWLFPELPWALAFTFGAIISPPDAVATTTILKRFSINSRLLSVLEGESLINDASVLVLYKIGVIALLSGTFSFAEGSLEFVKIVSGGIIIGIITGYVFHSFSSRFFDPVLAVVYSFMIPYLTYFIADFLEVSGVLAVVICGLIGSRMLVREFSSLTRVVGWASWDILIVLMNCFVFILIGLQLNGVLLRLDTESIWLYLGYGILLTAATILIRFLWVYLRKGIAYYQMREESKLRKQTLREAIIISWAGMRGIVSITAALALPFTLTNGTPLPGRDIVIYLTFIIIFITLVLPGLTLPELMRRLNIHIAVDDHETKFARKELIKAAKEELQNLYEQKHIDDKELSFLLTYFNTRHQIWEIASKAKISAHALETARIKVIQKKRHRLLELWEKNEINDKLFTLLEQELDTEEAYLARADL